jgi:hypothetical protein
VTGAAVSAPTAPRVAIVGVRRLRQGLGEHFARWLVAAGAEVPAFVGRTTESVDEGRRMLLARGIDARGFTSLDELLAAEKVDALVIASPAETHDAWLREALAANLHVLCEKPLVWDGDPAHCDVEPLVEEFLKRRLLLVEHCQWPCTLPAFRALHPGALDRSLRSFEMELAPSSRGESMLVDTLSHPFSLLQAISHEDERWEPPWDGRVEVRFSTRDPDADRLGVVVVLHGDHGRPEFEMAVRLESSSAHPRPAAYVVNGHRAERRIRLPDYAMTLGDGAREVPMEDPMKLAVVEFVAAVAEAKGRFAGRPSLDACVRRAAEIPVRMRFVAGIVSAFRARDGD